MLARFVHEFQQQDKPPLPAPLRERSARETAGLMIEHRLGFHIVEQGDVCMGYRDRQSCQSGYERELSHAGERLERLRGMVQRFRPDQRSPWELRLDEARGRLNRCAAKLEALRRSDGDTWRVAATHAAEAFRALAQALDLVDQGLGTSASSMAA